MGSTPGLTIQAFDPKIVKVNPAIAARSGEPDKKKIERFANNMLERREAKQSHQIQAGVVRLLPDGTPELIIGRHRLEAELKLNSMKPDEPFLFEATAIDSTDEQALLDAIDENEYRTATTVFDKGEAWQKLLDLGKTQKDVANRYGVPESTVSEYLRAAKLPKKIKAMVPAQLTEEGAIALARFNKDPQLLEEMLELSNQERGARESILTRADARAKGEAEPEPAPLDAKGNAPKSEAVKGKRSAASRKTPAGKITGGDVKRAAKKKGVSKRNVKTGRSKSDLIQLLQAKFGEKVDDVPEPYAELAEALESYLDGDLGDQALVNRWDKCVRQKFTAAA